VGKRQVLLTGVVESKAVSGDLMERERSGGKGDASDRGGERKRRDEKGRETYLDGEELVRVG